MAASRDDANDGRRNLRGVRALGIEREHGFEGLVPDHALLLEFLGGMLAAKMYSTASTEPNEREIVPSR